MAHMAQDAGRTRVVLYSDAEYFGGAEEYLALLARSLPPSRFALALVLPPAAGAALLESRAAAAGAEIRHLARPGFSWLPRIPEMIDCFRRCRGDVLHMNLPSTYDAGVSSVAFAARQAGIPRVVSTEHLPMIDRKYKKFPIKAFFTHWVDAVITPTQANRGFLVRRHGVDPGKVRVISNGVEPPPPLGKEEAAALRASWGAGPETAVFGIVGRLTRRKGHHLLLRALAQLEEERGLPPWLLVAVGEGEEDEALRALERELSLGGKVRWLGQQENARGLMQAFDLLVLPSTVETMPLTILEGMAASLPVAASAIFGIPDLVIPGETGLLFPPGDVAALAGALRALLIDPERRRRMGESGERRYRRRFTAARMTAETAAVYLGREAVAEVRAE
jgi:glycosyltransferase involved in cell wall biosynthesis